MYLCDVEQLLSVSQPFSLSLWVCIPALYYAHKDPGWSSTAVYFLQESSSSHSNEPGSAESRCHGCLSNLSSLDKDEQEPGVVLQCSGCKHLFCFDCDLYIHESLHNCPGCEASAVRHSSDGEDENAMTTN